MIRKWLILKIVPFLVFLAKKSQDNLNEGKYKRALKYLDWRDKFDGFIRLDSPSPITTTQRLELNFLTHNFKYVIDNIKIPINAVEKTRLDWSEADRNYLKVYNYNILLLTYTLLDDGDKMLETFDIVNDISVKGVSERMIGYYPAYTKERLKKLCESEPYYAQNFSEEILGNAYRIQELIWGK